MVKNVYRLKRLIEGEVFLMVVDGKLYDCEDMVFMFCDFFILKKRVV